MIYTVTFNPALDYVVRMENLNLGMVNRSNLPVSPMSELQALSFAVQELALYLDTHRNDLEALELYQQYQRMYAKCSAEYQQNRRPLNHSFPSEDEEYRWLDDPWPWEYAGNKEG